MDENRSHFWLPPRNVFIEKIKPPHGGKSYKRDNYEEHGIMLSKKISEGIEDIESKRDADLLNSLFFQIETPHDFKLKDTSRNFEKINIDLVSHSVNKNYQGVGRISKKDLFLLRNKLSSYTSKKNHPGKSYFAAMENFQLITSDEKIKLPQIEVGKEYKCIISFYNVLLKSEKEKVSSRVISLLEEWKIIDYKRIILVDDSVLISATLNYDQIKTIGEEFISVNTITLDSAVLVTHSYQSSSLPNDLSVQEPETNEMVCLVDSEITDKSAHLKGLIHETHSYLPQNSTNPEYSHGTLVGSRILFGDDIENQIANKQLVPCCKIIDVQIFGEDSSNEMTCPTESDVILLLNNLVPKISDKAKIFNLSFGFVNDYFVTPMTKLGQFLDSLSNKFQITFIVSTGNIFNFSSHPYPLYFQSHDSHLTAPAESLNAITVGSYAKTAEPNCWAKSKELSPFSRIGPGFNDCVKPELVEHGGNMLKSFTPTPKHSPFGLHSDGKSLAFDIGTSYAVPIICNYLVKIKDFYGDRHPNFYKAVLIHFCEDIESPALPIHPLYLRGFGRPDIQSVYSAKENNYAILHTGVISTNQYQWIHFHIPSCLAPENDNELEISVTLVYNPPINKDNLKEYSKARMNCTLYKNLEGQFKVIQAVNDNEKVATHWNPIIRFKKYFKRYYSTGEWRLRLRLYTRGGIEENYEQNYCIVIEVKDKTGKTNVYDSFFHEFSKEYLKIEKQHAA